MAGHGRAEATPSFRRLCPAMTKSETKPSADGAITPNFQEIFPVTFQSP
jgi:hypothetical protein